MTDFRLLLKKYISHVGAAEGLSFARDVDMSPCNLGEDEYSEEEEWELKKLFIELWDDEL